MGCIILICLYGPLDQNYNSKTELIIHLGLDEFSRTIPGEFEYKANHFIKYGHIIRSRYRITLKPDGLREPWYQIGKNGPREDFPIHTFAAPGTFIKHMAHIVQMHKWEELGFRWDLNEIKPEFCPTPIPLSGNHSNYTLPIGP